MHMLSVASCGTGPEGVELSLPYRTPATKDDMTTVLICDDHRMVREGLRQSVQASPGRRPGRHRRERRGGPRPLAGRAPGPRADGRQMPGLGGLEATRRLVREHPEARVVMLTGAGDRDAVALAISGGARGYLHKDVSHEELCAAVATALAETAARSAARAGAHAEPPARSRPS